MGYEFDKAVVLYTLRQLENPVDRGELEAWIGKYIMTQNNFAAYLATEIELEAERRGLRLYDLKGKGFECVVDQLLMEIKVSLEHPSVQKIAEYIGGLKAQEIINKIRFDRR